MGKYLVIIDETEEARKALRFAMHWAQSSGGSVQILAIVQPQNFNAFGGVQATIEQEARDRAEAIATSAAGTVPAPAFTPLRPREFLALLDDLLPS